MYIYFDRNGVLREIINTKVTAVGSANQYIYAYYEGQAATPSGVIRFRLPDGTLMPGAAPAAGTVESGEIPYDKNRDLKYFEYGKTYKFLKWSIDVATIVNGSVAATITYTDNDVMEMFTFEVTNSVVDLAQTMSMSDYQYLLRLFMNKEVFAVNDLPADMSIYPDNAVVIEINTHKIWINHESDEPELWADLGSNNNEG